MSASTRAIAVSGTSNRMSLRYAWILGVLMMLTSLLAWRLIPDQRISRDLGVLELESVIPKQFGNWTLDPTVRPVVANPELEASLKRIYSRTLARTYVSPTGERVMLSIAYGEDQRDGMQVHFPEICYPAQGRQIQSSTWGVIHPGGRMVPVKHVISSLGEDYVEPITYWYTVGTHVVASGLDKKIHEFSYGLKGQIPDGLLFRVSSVDRSPAAAYGLHERFTADLLSAVPPAVATRLVGQTAPAQ